MKSYSSVRVKGIAAALALAAMSAAQSVHAKPGGTDILHYDIQAQMQNTGTVATARGSVSLSQHSQGNSAKQTVNVKLSGLDAETSYVLQPVIGGDTNNVADAIPFTTDKHGKANLMLSDKGNGNGHGKFALPSNWEPLTGLSELDVLTDTNGTLVLFADLKAPSKFTYLVKRDISSGSVSATLQVNANTKKATVKLTASGLDAGATYNLVINGNTASTDTADSKGRLKIGAVVTTPSDALSITSVELQDSVGATVVSATLP